MAVNVLLDLQIEASGYGEVGGIGTLVTLSGKAVFKFPAGSAMIRNLLFLIARKVRD
jgi:hypothetical protein